MLKEGDEMKSGREQYIQFELLQEKYAIHISEIQEIIKMQEISELPNVMPYVKGVINLRGELFLSSVSEDYLA